MVRRWRSLFLEGRQNVHDDERSGRPVTATDNAAVAAVRNVVEADRRVTIDEIMIRLPPGIEIGRSSIGTIMSDVLNFRKVCARWVPHLLSENHKQQRMEAARAFLEMHRRDGYQLFSRIVTGDESWVHHSTPETKRQRMVWNDLKLAEFPLKMNLGKDAQNVQKITDLIKENPRTTLLELEQDTGISKTTIGKIVTKDLKLKKTPAKFIPRFLTNEQKLCRLATCENMLEMTRTDPEWKDKIITGDETWVYDYDPETKRQYAEWIGQGEPRPKKSRILKSRNTVLLVAFLDNKGIVPYEYLPAGQTVIKEMYLDILRHLREAIRKEMPEKWHNGDWILHHNNARPHTAHLVTSCFG
ncbi:hypothetical protein LAZ67_19001267 [Cordylochernes scorpioides]|uniref:Transposase n=1 Tax=Cordylochernes scorpioides TaxID=51811 RepID=A0ABY6LMA3_9ARAC|nr:hypothetical protein LAZ67_19001267 [Cordylochernes scorpioides]